MQRKPGIETKIDILDASQIKETFRHLDKNPNGIQNGVLSGELAAKIYDAVGSKGEFLNECCQLYGIKFDEEKFEKAMENVRNKTKKRTAMSTASKAVATKIHEKTDDSFKYKYDKIESHRYVVQKGIVRHVNLFLYLDIF